ncbi:MAG TPA: hypothetical protein PKW35_07760 [Nannocystaceae bacterium]|nr:hypothetical protein [Nannocystaceae bacterium]
MKILRGLYRGLEALYGAESGLDPADHLHVFAAGEGRGREVVVVREAEDGALEIALAIDGAAIERLEASTPEAVLDDACLGDALPVIEGLSHLLYLAEAARRERPISGLELETQAEVDKLALCLFHRQGEAPGRYPALCERLFHRFELAADLDEGLRERYETANRLALAFARRLDRAVGERRWGALRRQLHAFWSAGLQEKVALGRG